MAVRHAGPRGAAAAVERDLPDHALSYLRTTTARGGRTRSSDCARPWHGTAIGAAPAQVAEPAAAVRRGVGVEHLAPEARARHAHAVVVARDGREVARHQQHVPLVARPCAGSVSDRVVGVVGVDPLEARRVEVELVQRRLAAEQAVEVAGPALHAPVRRVLEQVPVQAGVVVPLLALGELAAHEEQLLARLRVHVAEQQRAGWRTSASRRPASWPSSEPLPCTTSSWESGRHEVLGEGVEHAEGEVVVVVAAVDRVLATCTAACRASSPCPT